MIETYNIKDSYNDYRRNLLIERLKKVSPNSTEYKRLPIKLIERLEAKLNIILEIKDPGISIYNEIVYGYLKFILKKIFEGNDVRLGARLGIIGIRGKKIIPVLNKEGKIKGVAPSWGKTKLKWIEEAKSMGLTFEEYLKVVPKENRKLVYCFNEHTEYIRYRIVWYKKNVVVKNKIFYGLTFNRVNRRTLWNLINEGKEYFVIE